MLTINRLITNVLLASTLFAAAASEASNCGKVWNGTIERVRVQEQDNGDTIMLLYAYPGNNADFIGNTKSPLMIDMLLRGKEKGVEMTGYTNDSCKITWADLR
jgi:hypothetical protein